nr:hypothetical protein GCM10020185_64530 [Pseudomonas brassicacearum subsp. brassicacearum]
MPSAFESVLKKNKNMAYRPLGAAPASQAPIRVAFVLMDNFSMMSFTGAVDALVTANLMSDMPLYEVLTVGGFQVGKSRATWALSSRPTSNWRRCRKTRTC